jgi:hypothetical protein
VSARREDRELSGHGHKSRSQLTTGDQITTVPSHHQANYINVLAVSVSPFFEPAKVTLVGLFFAVGGFFYDIGWIFFWHLVNS